MRTSLTETEQIDAFLMNRMPQEERLVMEAKISISSELYTKVQSQRIAYDLIRQYGADILREEIRKTDHKLFNHSGFHRFQQKILSIFK
ncbi:MAG: hypothetical protein WBA74_22385 [Cyclobacteriaceae bacterium]